VERLYACVYATKGPGIDDARAFDDIPRPECGHGLSPQGTNSCVNVPIDAQLSGNCDLGRPTHVELEEINTFR
jgi:hypothetical protein